MGPDDASRVHTTFGRYLLHAVGWWIRSSLACYGSVVGVPPPINWMASRPRYWRGEARRGLRDCGRFLGQSPTARDHHPLDPA